MFDLENLPAFVLSQDRALDPMLLFSLPSIDWLLLFVYMYESCCKHTADLLYVCFIYNSF